MLPEGCRRAEAAVDPPVKVPLAIEDWLAVRVMGALCLIIFAKVLVRCFPGLMPNSRRWTH